MKRLFGAIAVLIATASIASAQDYNTAVEAHNNAAATSDKTEILGYLREALSIAEACEEEEAVLLAETCRDEIVSTLISLAKEKFNDGDFDAARGVLDETVTVAKEYNREDIIEEAEELVALSYKQQGLSLLKAKQSAEAAEYLQKYVATVPEDAQANLLLGQALAGSGKVDEAVTYLEVAAQDEAQAKAATGLLSNLFLKKGQAAIKAKKVTEAVELLEKANEYNENANAYYLLGTAYTGAGKKAQAVEAYKKFLELKPGDSKAVDIRYTIAVTAQQLGDKATAIEYYSMLDGTKYAETAKAQLGQLKK